MTLEPLCVHEDGEAYAIATFLWPGQTERKNACLVCLTRAVGIAEVMGFKLDVQKIPGMTIAGHVDNQPVTRLLEID